MVSIETALQGWIVVVVDDEPDSLEVATVLLEMHGAVVLEASDGQAGHELIRNKRPHLIISDLSMPNMTGWQMLDRLKMDDRSIAEIPVIALTAHAMEQDRRRAIAAGFHNFISKPLVPKTFVHQIIGILAVDRPELRHFLEATD